MILLDSSAVVGFLQPDDPLHDAASRAIGSMIRGGERLILATADVHPEIRRVVGGDARWSRVSRSLDASFVRLRAAA